MRRRSLLLLGPRTLSWVDDELLAPGDDEVLVETIAGAVSVGSELPLFRGDARSTLPPTYPRMTGYESLAIVRLAGANVADVRTGDRVVATYGHRTAALVPAAKTIPVPVAVPDDLALLAILTCDVAKGIGKLDPPPNAPILVTGAGAIGLLTVWSLVARGLGPVDVLEPDPHRRMLAWRLGARLTASAPADLPLSGDYSNGVECSSNPLAFAALQDALERDGRICVLADGNREPLTLSPAFHEKELAIVGSSDGLDYRTHARWFFDTLTQHPGALADLYDLRIRAADLAPAFAGMADGAIRPVKVFVDYGADPQPANRTH